MSERPAWPVSADEPTTSNLGFMTPVRKAAILPPECRIVTLLRALFRGTCCLRSLETPTVYRVSTALREIPD